MNRQQRRAMERAERKASKRKVQPMTQAQRNQKVNEVILKIHEHELQDDPGSQELFQILYDYRDHGIPVQGKEICLQARMDPPRKYVIDLHNNQNIRDSVLIRAQSKEDQERIKAQIVKRQEPQDDCPELICS